MERMSSLETDGRSLYYNLIHHTADGFMMHAFKHLTIVSHAY